MRTVSVQIGNGDDKLSQSQWHRFVVEMKQLIEAHCRQLHFFGAPENWCPQQNVAFIFDIDDGRIEQLQIRIADLRQHFLQQSAAWTEGVTRFI